MSSKNHSKVMSELENIRGIELQALNDRKEEVYKKIPRIKTIENEIASKSVQIALNSMKINGYDEINKLKNEVKNLREEKLYLLEKSGYESDYLTIRYNCNKCQDTGFVNGEQCSCYKNILIKQFYSNDEFSNQLKDYTFENFDISIFDDNKKLASSNLTLRQLMNQYLDYIYKYLKGFRNNNDNIFIYGGTGTGKTFLATCIANALLEKGHSVVYRTSDTLINDLSSIKFNNESIEAKEKEDIILNCDLLIVDDLGTENITDYSRTLFFNFINKKLLMNKKMIITTNFDLSEIKNMYSERIFSRIVGDFKAMMIPGDDIRIKNFKSILG